MSVTTAQAEIMLEDAVTVELIAELREKITAEAVALTENELLPTILSVANYTYDDASIVISVDSTDVELLQGKVNVTYSVKFSTRYPDPFQIAQQLIVQGLLQRL